MLEVQNVEVVVCHSNMVVKAAGEEEEVMGKMIVNKEPEINTDHLFAPDINFVLKMCLQELAGRI